MEEIRCVECVHPRATDPCCTVEAAPLCRDHAVRALARMSEDERRQWFADTRNRWNLDSEEAFEMVQLAALETAAR